MRYIGERSNDPALLVLTSLADGAKHGYAITTDVEEFAGVRLGPGTLYGALARLESRGLIEALPAEDRRRPYRLTADGSAALEHELQTLQSVASRETGSAPGSGGRANALLDSPGSHSTFTPSPTAAATARRCAPC